MADQIGVTRQALWKLRKNDEEFAKAWDEAAEIGDRIKVSVLEKEADFRGQVGWIEPKYFEGRICGYIPKFSDSLLTLRLKALAPERYGDKTKVDATLNGASGIVLEFVSPHATNSDT